MLNRYSVVASRVNNFIYDFFFVRKFLYYIEQKMMKTKTAKLVLISNRLFIESADTGRHKNALGKMFI